MQNKVIILGCKHGGVAIARSFGKRNFDILVLTTDSNESGLRSKYVKNWQICPAPDDEEAFIQSVLSYADTWQGAMIFCTSDAFAQTVSKHKAQLSEYYVVDVADWEHTRIFLEKDLTYKLAEEAGVPHPKFLEIDSMEGLEAALPDLQLPIMIKPVNSFEFVQVFGEKLFINETVEELRENFQRVVDAKQAVVVSEIIPGSDYRTLETVQIYINNDGSIATQFCCIKLRQTPPMYGVIRVGHSMEPKADLVELGTKLLRHIDYRGYGSVEFKRDPRDNQLKLIEVNIRSLRMSQLPIASGVDIPWIWYKDKVKNEPIQLDDYRVGMHYIDLTADFLDYFRYDEDKRLKTLFEPYWARHKTTPYLWLSDPMPFLAELGRRFSRVGKLFKRG